MKKQEAKEVVEYAFERVKACIELWHNRKMEQIRLKSANIKRIEEYKQYRKKFNRV